MIYDLITILIAIVCIVIGAIKGAAKTLLNFITVIVSYVAAVFLGELVAGAFYNGVIKDSILSSVSDSVTNTANGTVSSILDALPDTLRSFFSLSDTKLDMSVASTASGVSETVEGAVRPLILSLISLIATIVIFSLLCVILRLLVAKPLSKVFETTALKGVNRFFGGVLGLLEAIVAIFLLAYLLKLLLPLIKPDSYFFSESTIYNSYIFYHFYSGNIFSSLTTLF